jgi:hypothetical protein
METSLDQTSKTQATQGNAAVASDLASDLKHHAGEITEQAKAKAKDVAHSGQAAAADQLQHLAEGVRRSADNFDEEQAWIKQGLSTAAESLERFSSTLRDRDLGDLMHEAEDAARRHPVIFAAACAAAGFALVRFLKSSSRDMADTREASMGTYRDVLGRGGLGREHSDYGATTGTAQPDSRRSGDYSANI